MLTISAATLFSVADYASRNGNGLILLYSLSDTTKIENTLEIPMKELEIDMTELHKKTQNMKKMHNEIEILGVWDTGRYSDEQILRILQQLSGFIEVKYVIRHVWGSRESPSALQVKDGELTKAAVEIRVEPGEVSALNSIKTKELKGSDDALEGIKPLVNSMLTQRESLNTLRAKIRDLVARIPTMGPEELDHVGEIVAKLETYRDESSGSGSEDATTSTSAVDAHSVSLLALLNQNASQAWDLEIQHSKVVRSL